MAKITYDATTRMVSLHLDTHVVQVTATTFRQLFANGLMDVVRQLMGDSLPPVRGVETLPSLSEPYAGEAKPVPKDGEHWNTVITFHDGKKEAGVSHIQHITKDTVYFYVLGKETLGSVGYHVDDVEFVSRAKDNDLIHRYPIDQVEFVSRADADKTEPAKTGPQPGEWWHVRIAVGESVYRAYVDRISDTGDIVHMKVGKSSHVLAYDYKSVEFICPINDGVKPLAGQWWQVIIKHSQEAKMRIDRMGMAVTLEGDDGGLTTHPQCGRVPSKVRHTSMGDHMTTEKPTKVAIIESERGWGRKIDEVKEFPTRAEAEAFVTKFNSKNTADEVPDWYMVAEIME